MTYFERLERAESLRRGSRPSRLFRRPIAMLAPWALRKAGRTWGTSCTTFFGEPMSIILPETVSTELYRYGFFESDVCRAMLTLLRPGDAFYDIGSHFGFFSMLARRLVGPDGQVVAVEATPSTAAVTRRNLARWPNAEVVNKACWEKPGYVVINDYGVENSGFNSLWAPRQGAAENAEFKAQAIQVEAVDFDTLSAELGFAPNFVKIDAESSELAILNGMSRTLGEDRPILSIEMGDFGVEGAPPSREIVDFVLARDYFAYSFEDRMRRHEPKTHYGYENLVFIPEERAPADPD
jgi:FkbM family methyltransferase